MTAAVKRYAPANSGEAPRREAFVMVFLRNGVEEDHEFTAIPRGAVGYADAIGLGLSGDRRNDGRTLAIMDRILRRALVDDDGTPARWEPAIDDDGNFTDPAGDQVPEEMLPQYLAFEAGSSRRRWIHLMDEDDDVTVELDQVGELFRDLVREASAGRPTKR